MSPLCVLIPVNKDRERRVFVQTQGNNTAKRLHSIIVMQVAKTIIYITCWKYFGCCIIQLNVCVDAPNTGDVHLDLVLLWVG